MRVASHTFSIVFSVFLLIGILAWLFLTGHERPEPPQLLATPLGLQGEVFQPILPLVPIEGLDPERVALGELLFHDTRLSADAT
ncbi:MAG: hypothetical protein FWD50_07970, partial [Betaproteobacteria bacterium]|nr:hypothetical protein [Betaproteobacteria bacterium]